MCHCAIHVPVRELAGHRIELAGPERRDFREAHVALSASQVGSWPDHIERVVDDEATQDVV
eukprot:11312422-Alexandrium_andersonii.AAC.1